MGVLASTGYSMLGGTAIGVAFPLLAARDKDHLGAGTGALGSAGLGAMGGMMLALDHPAISMGVTGTTALAVGALTTAIINSGRADAERGATTTQRRPT